MSNLLDRNAILNSDDLGSEVIEVEAWGGKVRIQELTATDRDKYTLSVAGADKDLKKVLGAQARLVAMTVVDDEGRRIFTKEDVTALGEKSPRALQLCFDKALELAGLTDTSAEDEGKDSESSQSSDSSTDSA